MIKDNSLLDHTYLFSFNEYENNDNIIIKYFQWLKTNRKYINIFKKVNMKNIYCIMCNTKMVNP